MERYTSGEHEVSQSRGDTENRMLDGNNSWMQYSSGQREYKSRGSKWRVPKISIFQVEKECLKAAASVSKQHNRKVLKKPNDVLNTNDVLPSSNGSAKFESFEGRNSNTTKFATLDEDDGNGFCESRKLDANIFEKTGNRNSFDLSSFSPTENQNIRYPEKNKNDEVGQGKRFFLLNQDTIGSESETRSNLYRYEASNLKEVELDPPNEGKYPCDNLFARGHKDNKTVKQENKRGTDNLQIPVTLCRALSIEETLSKCQLPDLLHFDISVMEGPVFLKYALLLKYRIEENILEFKYPVNEELRFLCAISDGNQTERNQRLITARTCHILYKNIETYPHILNIRHVKQSYQEPDLKISNFSEMQQFPRSSPFQTSNYSPTLVSSDHLVSNTTWKSNHLVSDIPLFSNHPLPATSQILVRQVSDSENKSYNSNSFEELNFHTPVNTRTYSSIPNGNSIEQSVNSVAVFENGNFVDNDGEYSKCGTSDNGLNTLDNGIELLVGINAENASKEPLEYIDTPVEKTKKSPLVKKRHYDDGEITFFSLSLEKLLQYDVELMLGNSLSDYAFSIKDKVLENICKFENPVKEKLEFLCELTDGTQTESNQKLITERMCYLIANYNEICSAYRSDGSPTYRSDRNHTCITDRNPTYGTDRNPACGSDRSPTYRSDKIFYNRYFGSETKLHNQHKNRK